MNTSYASIAVTLCSSYLLAQPSGHEVAHGSADVQALQNLLQITTSDKAIINWKEFSSQTGEIIRFVQPSSTSAVLNRVTGGNTSTLYGDLQTNGQVYLVNPNGIVIGQHARIDAGAFTASTFDVLDSDFIEGSAMRFFGDSKAGVINLGMIKTSSGDVSLIGFSVESDGTIEAAGKASLVASNKVILKPYDSQRIFIAADADITPGDTIDNPYLLAFNQTIEKDALHFKKDDTGVFLIINAPTATVSGPIAAESVAVLGDYVQILDGASVDVSEESGGGQILIGGDFQGSNETILNAQGTYVSKEARLISDALHQGNGGKVIVWAEDLTGFYGNISTRGGPLGGDGGFVEVSGKHLDFQGFVDRVAPSGAYGTLLLDPIDITISVAADSANIVNPGGGGTYTFTAGCGSTTANIQTIAPGNLQANLIAGPVTINTSATNGAACAGTGNITIADPITWGSAGGTTLTLVADGSITVNAGANVNATGPNDAISFTSANGMVINANVQNSNVATGGNVSLRATSGDITITGAAPFGTNVIVGNMKGAVTVQACNGSIFINPNPAAAGLNYTGIGSINNGAGTYSGNIVAEASQNISLLGGATADSVAAFIGHGIELAGADVLRNVTATAGGDITITGGSFPSNCFATIGFDWQNNVPIGDTRQGDITVNAGGNVTLTCGGGFSSRGHIGMDAGTNPTLRCHLAVNVGGNLLIQGSVPVSAFAYIGFGIPNNDAAASVHVTVGGNCWVDGRLVRAGFIPAYSIAPVPGYNPDFFLHCGGDITFIGGTTGGVAAGAQIRLDDINPGITSFVTHIWAGGRIRCLNGQGNYATLGDAAPFQNLSIRAAGDVLTGGNVSQGAADFIINGTGTYAGYAYPAFSGVIIEADACFGAGELWPALSASVCGAGNVFASTPLGSPSPGIACDSLGVFSPAVAIYSTPSLNALPFPYNGSQLPLVVLSNVGSQQFDTSPGGGNIVIHSANTFQGETFDPQFNGIGSMAINNTLPLGLAPADSLNLTTTSGNIEVTGPACGCGQSYYNLSIDVLPPSWTSGSITLSATNDAIINDSVDTSGAASPIQITAGHDVLINFPITAVGGPISTTAGNNTIVAGTSISTAGPITMISGVDMQMTGASSIASSGSSVILVVDNLFPSPPDFGPGLFDMSAASSISSAGPLQIFTSQQNLNIIAGTLNLNGATFSPGTLFANSATEHWCTYYPNPFFGGVFTVFYKDCLNVITVIANEVVSEMLFTLAPENMWVEELLSPLIPPEVWRFMLIYGPGVNAYTHFAQERYWLSRRNIHFIHYPYVYKENKPLAELVPPEAAAPKGKKSRF